MERFTVSDSVSISFQCFLSVVIRLCNGPVSCLIMSRTESFITQSTLEMPMVRDFFAVIMLSMSNVQKDCEDKCAYWG